MQLSPDAQMRDLALTACQAFSCHVGIALAEPADMNREFDVVTEWVESIGRIRPGGKRHASFVIDPYRIQMAERQLSLEDHLGRMITERTPTYVLERLGPPPRASLATSSDLVDIRPWVAELGLQLPMSQRRHWERVAGAFAAVVTHYCSGNAEIFEDLHEEAATLTDTRQGRTIHQQFEEAARMVQSRSLDFGLV